MKIRLLPRLTVSMMNYDHVETKADSRAVETQNNTNKWQSGRLAYAKFNTEFVS